MNKILLMPNRAKDRDYSATLQVARFLSAYPVTLAMSEENTDCGIGGIMYESIGKALSDSDMIIVFGGDGSMLEAAHLAAGAGRPLPLLGINMGRVGYMTGLECEETGLLDRLFTGEYHIEERIMLEAVIEHENGGRTVTSPALNEIVLSSSAVSRITELELTTRDGLIGDYRADGVIFSTPTGSTAYSMSAGGSVLDPALSAVAVTPICPHSFSSRPIVFSADTEIFVSCKSSSDWCITFDGQENRILGGGDRVTVRKSECITRLLNLKKNGFYDVLRRKTSEMK